MHSRTRGQPLVQAETQQNHLLLVGWKVVPTSHGSGAFHWDCSETLCVVEATGFPKPVAGGNPSESGTPKRFAGLPGFTSGDPGVAATWAERDSKKG